MDIIKSYLKEKINYNKEDLKDHHGVGAVIYDKQGKVLMQEHVKYKFWTIPVGKVKSNQSIIDGLREEILEETNIKILKQKEIARKVFKYKRVGYGYSINVDSHVFEVLSWTGTPKNLEPHKHSQQLFMPINQIKQLKYLSDLTKMFLKAKNL
jgi:ADP-ribose pyrophosphatase YjhB (NUDIX family)|tara:strand:- start:2500 stop:2958 length:459 start_codon:yes stop_codon:yes gene_type:complete